jgi:hypothetical protein
MSFPHLGGVLKLGFTSSFVPISRRPPAGIPLSGRVPGRAPRSSRSHDGGGLQYVSWKRDVSFRFFPSRGTYRRRGSVRRWTRRSHHRWARPRARPRPLVVRLAPGPPPSHLWSSWSFGKNRRFSFCFIQFREYFLCSFSETQKQQKTGNWHCGILLIGYFRKMHKNATKCNKTQSKWCKNKHGSSNIIDTFETYQASPSLIPARPQVGKW